MQKIYLVQDRFDFPQLLIPVYESIPILQMQKGCKKVPCELSVGLDRKLGLSGVNVDWRESGELYWGGSNVFSGTVGYNRIVGVDDIELYLTGDSYEDFFDQEDGHVTVSQKGAVMTPCTDVQVISPVETDVVIGCMGNRYLSFEKAFQKGKKLLAKYPFRKGNVIRGYGVHNVVGPCYIGVLVLIPPKRDYEAAVVKVFCEETEQLLQAEMLGFESTFDPTMSSYSQRFMSTFRIGDELATVGFLSAAAHLTLFEHDTACHIAGVSIHDLVEGD